MENVVGYINSNREKYVEELKDFLRIPSISTLAANKSDMITAAEFVAGKLREAGMENVKIIETKGHPLVYADWLHAAGKPTYWFTDIMFNLLIQSISGIRPHLNQL
jgi:acetylornithine deacetylase/succinyl-diaminopimelate desuccinylase-like protein